MRVVVMFLLIFSFAFSKADYSQMSNEELIALIGYVSKKNLKDFNEELKKRLPTFSKEEKQQYEQKKM